MGGADVEERIEQPRQIAAHEQRGHARLVGLEGQGDDVAHQPHVFADVFGQAVVGPGHGDHGPIAALGVVAGPVHVGPRPLHAPLHLADAGEVFIQLGPVGAADLPLQRRGLVADPVEDARGPPAALVIEQAVEGQRRIDLHRHGRVGVLPGNVRAVGHREIGLVIAGDRLFAAEHQARLRRVFLEVSGQDLIHAGAAAQDRAALQGRAGEDVAGLPGMDADARGVAVEQAGDDVELGPIRIQRLQAACRAAFPPPTRWPTSWAG